MEKEITYEEVITDHIKEILNRHKNPTDVVEETKRFVYDILGPSPDRGDMQYRYEHCIRVFENGRELARAEGLPEEALSLACLLHDVGYRESDRFGGFRVHQITSAHIARAYLELIDYDERYREEMIAGIYRHNLTDKLPEDMTVFQMSVRDCDDIDRFDIIRIAETLGECTHEKASAGMIESCNKAIDHAKWLMGLKRGTKTAKERMNALLSRRITLLEEVIAQAKKGF
ncbi:MAG: HD domain-containing protein [Lachnospiraceae bacterium]|nr:HD domain-containing protein [Lachnospiraceae bacterium]